MSLSSLASRAIRNEAIRLGAPPQPYGSELDAVHDEAEHGAMEHSSVCPFVALTQQSSGLDRCCFTSSMVYVFLALAILGVIALFRIAYEIRRLSLTVTGLGRDLTGALRYGHNEPDHQ